MVGVALLRQAYRSVMAVDAAYKGNMDHVCRAVFGAAVHSDQLATRGLGRTTREVFWNFVRLQRAMIRQAPPAAAAALSMEAVQKGFWLLRTAELMVPSKEVDAQYEELTRSVEIDFSGGAGDKKKKGVRRPVVHLSTVAARDGTSVALPRHCIPGEPLWLDTRDQLFGGYPFVRDLAAIAAAEQSQAPLWPLEKPLEAALLRPASVADPGAVLRQETVSTFEDCLEIKVQAWHDREQSLADHDGQEHYRYTVTIRNTMPPVAPPPEPAAKGKKEAKGKKGEKKASPRGAKKQLLAKLISRHWYFCDGTRTMREVTGPGVVGEFPLLAPGEKHTYTSGTSLGGSGFMLGTLQFLLLEVPVEHPALAKGATPRGRRPTLRPPELIAATVTPTRLSKHHK